VIKAVPVKDVLKGLEDMLKDFVQDGISICIEQDCDLKINADANKMMQALLNICNNACDSMPDGGTLTVNAKSVFLDKKFCSRFDDVPEGEYCEISISDTGHGIPDKLMPHIFEPFFTTKSAGKGTGLGLPITAGIVRMHAGHINVESGDGGSVFKVYLPAAKDAKTDCASTDEVTEAQNHEILVIDDDTDFLAMIKDLLSTRGYAVTAVSSGAEGINVFRNDTGRFGLVILDMIMPGMDGATVFQNLRLIQSDVKIIICSGFSGDIPIMDLLKNGAFAFLHKPFDARDLEELVVSAFNE